MDISQLRTIINVSELGSLSRAAERMRIAQPALSRQLRLLEQDLGVRLFDRHGRGMVPTDAGHIVLRHAQRVLAELEDLRASVSDDDAPLSGHVSVGVPPTIADRLAVPLVQAMSTRHPDATIRIFSANSAFLEDWLHRGDIDVAILFETRAMRSLQVRPLMDEVLYLIGPPESDLMPDRPVSFAKLEGLRLLMPGLGNGLRTVVEQCAEQTGIRLDVRTEADSHSTLKSLVRNGLGLTILPLAPVHADVTLGRLTCAPIVDPVPQRRLLLSTQAGRVVPRLARFAMQSIISTAEQLVRTGIWSGHLLDPDDLPKR